MKQQRLAILLVLLIAAVAARVLVSRATRRVREVPTSVLTYQSHAVLYETRGDTARAASYYDSALMVMPDYAEACEGLRKVRPNAVC